MNLFHIKQISAQVWCAYDGRGTQLYFRTERSAWRWANLRNRELLS